ncbi:MAG: hypothetical protein KatS3mg051_1546 [Anaerolineae bacterium]|nr:MAG: hypothetical protein KatS3mg051_1546 [Anaerolineae bacterium]
MRWLAAIAMAMMPMAMAQGDGILTPGATAWFVALAAVVALGVPTTRRIVDFLRARPWLAWFQGERVLLLSFPVATGWVFFFFQPGLLNVEAFNLLPMWQSYVFSIVLIAAYAGGLVDGERGDA